MAKDFNDKLKPQPKKRRKPSDEEILKNTTQKDEINTSKSREDSPTPSEKTKSVRLSIRLPANIHDKLVDTCKNFGLTKTAIIIQGINSEVKRLNKE